MTCSDQYDCKIYRDIIATHSFDSKMGGVYLDIDDTVNEETITHLTLFHGMRKKTPTVFSKRVKCFFLLLPVDPIMQEKHTTKRKQQEINEQIVVVRK